MADTDLQCLKEMGFSAERGKIALDATSGQGLQAAIEWLFAHPEDSEGQRLGSGEDPNESSSSSKPESLAESNGSSDKSQQEIEKSEEPEKDNPAQPLSLVCEECGKQLRSENDVQVHAARTGHQSFAESTEEVKPLTEEEKKEQLKRLEERMTQRRKEREEAERQADRQREKARRKTGKELTDVKQRMEFEEAKRIAEQRRKEKLEDRLLRQKLKQKIAQDRLDQQARQGTHAGPTQQVPLGNVNAPSTNVTSITQEIQPKKEYDTCRIQFRLTNGSAMTHSFKPSDLLSDVYQYISSNRTDNSCPFSLMTTFPRKTYSDTDMTRTLSELGLVPSCVLVLTKT